MFLKSILLNSVLLLLQVQSSPVVQTTPTKSLSTNKTSSVKNSTTTSTTKTITSPSKSSSNLTSKTTPSKIIPVVITPPPSTGFLCAAKAYPLANCGIVNQQGNIRSVPADIITIHNVTHYSCDEVFQEETLGGYCCQVMLRQGAKYCKAAVVQILT
ncbi:uncharacterized protein MELLADRAFT_70759 [Melampsora larici-populina 98AG31]|uniref:Secreted protein n=1 Tax=Melampsora larici-populina (strain 98AG31 / pathotype 3-4-7) TaxID=747676 RepID=F4R7N3_MELLP|nr:uncharacterized protein MELLADRAFT_70759 [Melampsora larici-populina 98AG31]EGG11757.1 secreted protein [Melampsora larici-populina 98AG31]